MGTRGLKRDMGLSCAERMGAAQHETMGRSLSPSTVQACSVGPTNLAIVPFPHTRRKIIRIPTIYGFLVKT